MTGVEVSGSAGHTMVGEYAADLHQLHSGHWWHGNTLDGFLVEEASIIGPVDLNLADAWYDLPYGLNIGAGGDLDLRSGDLLLGNSIVVDQGTLYSTESIFLGTNGSFDGIVVTGHPTSDVNVQSADISGFNNGVYIGRTPDDPARALFLNCDLHDNTSYGAYCEGSGGCGDYQIDSGYGISGASFSGNGVADMN